MDLKNQFTTATSFSKLLALALFVFLPFVFFLFGIKFQKSTTMPTICSRSPVKKSTPKPVSQLVQGQYSSAKNGYKIDIPNTWWGEVSTEGDQETLLISSPDATWYKYGDGYGFPATGTQIEVEVTSSEFKDTDELINSLKPPKNGIDYSGMFVNPRSVTIDGNQAIQYEWTYEGYLTYTKLVKNGLLYKFSMTHESYPIKNPKYLDTYNQILKTVTFN
jgi:hypothetical protein